ncbi:DUF2088 domain-containing protein [Myxococcota bacterium]|nr:DUF2088 domain-containing protein [Myxococcota bacterium]
MRVDLGWGLEPLRVEIPDEALVLTPPQATPSSWSACFEAALAAPIYPAGGAGLGGHRALRAQARGRRVCVLVPDETRKDVASQLLPRLLRHLHADDPARGPASISVGVATGKHPPCAAPPGAWVHRADDPSLVYVGHTEAGTDVRFPRAVVEADLRILLGEIRPHYFAGYAGGAKGLFPGVAGEAGIWHNHEMKALAGARLGQVEGNPCRADMEAAAALAGPSFIINIIRDVSGAPISAVAGDPIAAHREGVRRAEAIFTVAAPRRAPTVIVSDRSPVTMNLYQACKLLPPAGAILEDGGLIIMAASCHAGIGPVEVINDKIYRLGIRHSLPPRHRVALVSSQPAAAVAPTFAEHAPSVEAALAGRAGPVVVLPFAGDLVVRAEV